MVAWRAADLLGKACRDEIQRRGGPFAGEVGGPIFGDELVFVAVRDGEVESDATGLRDGAGGLDGIEEALLGAGTQGGQEIALVLEAFIQGGSRRAGRLCNRTHSKSMLTAIDP